MSIFDELIGLTVYDKDHDKIGKISKLYSDDTTGEPSWATVQTGLFGTKENFFPLSLGQRTDDGYVLTVEKGKVTDAPRYDDDDVLAPEDEGALFRYYGLSDEAVEGINEYAEDANGQQGHDTSGPTTDDAMTRSEEMLEVGTERQETGRMRLKKYIQTENVTMTVPVQKEVARLEREPITESNMDAATEGPELSEEEHEVTLYEEVPTVSKTVQPVERVKLTKESVESEEEISEDLKKEQIELEGDRKA